MRYPNGHEFEYKYLRPSQIEVDPLYQRSLDTVRVDKIVKNFNGETWWYATRSPLSSSTTNFCNVNNNGNANNNNATNSNRCAPDCIINVRDKSDAEHQQRTAFDARSRIPGESRTIFS